MKLKRLKLFLIEGCCLEEIAAFHRSTARQVLAFLEAAVPEEDRHVSWWPR